MIGKHILISLISISLTLLILRLLKKDQIKNNKENREMKDKISLLTSTPEFKILLKNKEFLNLLETPEFLSLGFTFGRDFILEQLGL